MSYFCSPLRYPGGKNCIFPFISRLFHENNIIGLPYAEPYAGGAGLALRLLFEEYVSKIYLNDLDRSIYAFWYTILNKGDDFCGWIDGVDVSIDSWLNYKEIQSSCNEVDVFELAKSTFFLNRTNVSGIIKGGVIGGQKQLGKFKIDARFNKSDLISRIKRIERFKDRIELSNLDGINFLKRCNSKNEKVFIYLDPPYFKKGAKLYLNSYSDHDHKRLAKHAQFIKGLWMTSYDNHEFILNLYKSKRKVIYQLSQNTSNRIGDEVLIFCENLQYKASLAALNSAREI